MASVEWGEYRIDDLFNIYTGRDVIIGKTSPGEIPLISHQNTENGVTRRIEHISNRRIFHYEETISLADRGVFYATTQNEDFHIGTRVKALVFKDGKKSENVRLFFSSAINKLQILFTDYSSNATDKLPKYKIQLPVLNGQIDYNFMEGFIEELEAERIEELEAERIEELEAYLSVSGLKDTQLTADELSALDKLKSNKIFWKEYTIDQLFDIVTTAHRFDANKINIIENGRYPYIVRTSNNNGQRGFIDENPIYLNSGNTISFGQDTATIFYQEKPYFTGDKIKILIPKLLNFRKENAQFFISTMNLTFSNFTWGSTRFNVDILKNQIVKIPISSKDKEIDFVFMETLIKAIQKLVIADVVKFSDEKIKATKQVVG